MIGMLLVAIGVREAAAQYRSDVVDPKTYRAPSGRFELTVDQSNDDDGSAKYRFTENGKKRWSSTLPFILTEAAFTKSGATVGYDDTQTRASWPTLSGRDESREFRVVMRDRDGKVRLKDSVKARIIDGEFSCPHPRGLLVDEPNDRIIVRIASREPDQLESWWIYRLSTAAAAGKQNLSKLWKDPQSYRNLSAIKPIPGTPLTLVHFVRNGSRIRRGTHGATFALLDLQGRLVWSLELPTDYMASDRETGEKFREMLVEGRGILRSDQPREFDLFFAAASQRVTFSVTQTASGEWTAKETARSGYNLGPAPKGTLISLRKQPLKPLAPLVLPMRQRGPSEPIQQANELGMVRWIAIDPKGQIYAIDRKTGAMHVFDSSGRFLHICPATLKDFSGLVPDPVISFGDQGDVYLGPGEGIEGLSRRCPYAHFDANGERLNAVVWIGFTSWLQPGTNRLIELSFDLAALNDPSGNRIRELVLRPDGRQLSRVESASVAADGSFAILASEYEQGATVNVFAAAGDPICTIPLPGLIGVIEFAYDGRRIVVAAEQGLFFFDRSGEALYRCDPPLPPRSDSIHVPYLLADGRTAALFDGRTPVLYRYQLP
jgi:hypothetical protein